MLRQVFLRRGRGCTTVLLRIALFMRQVRHAVLIEKMVERAGSSLASYIHRRALDEQISPRRRSKATPRRLVRLSFLKILIVFTVKRKKLIGVSQWLT